MCNRHLTAPALVLLDVLGGCRSDTREAALDPQAYIMEVLDMVAD